MGKRPSVRLEVEAVGHISDTKQLEAHHTEKSYGVRYAEAGYNSYFSLTKFKTKRGIQICWPLANSKLSNRNTVMQYIIRPKNHMLLEIRTEQYSNRMG